VCGIFAYAGIGSPDPDVLEACALAAGRRGPHGHGWITRDGADMEVVRRLGPVADSVKEIRDITAHLVLGHARLATFGDWQDPEQLQPIVAWRHGLAHNGSVYNAATMSPWAATDSIALASAYAAMRAAGQPPQAALDALVAGCQQHAWAIVIADADGSMLAHRSYHPLYTWPHKRGNYVCSWPLDPAAELLPAGQAVHISRLVL
jgi:glutamine phosphoribosylpyrophosphate amidotransferase